MVARPVGRGAPGPDNVTSSLAPPGQLLQEYMTPESWRSVGRSLSERRSHQKGTASRLMWNLGDWLLAGEDSVFMNLNRSKVRQLASELSGYSRHTLTMAVSIARKVHPSVRVDGISWWHHQCVADRAPEEQTRWLTRAAEEGWSVAALRAQIRGDVVSGKASSMSQQRAARVVHGLVRLNRSDLSEEQVVQLREWWRTEMQPAT